MVRLFTENSKTIWTRRHVRFVVVICATMAAGLLLRSWLLWSVANSHPDSLYRSAEDYVSIVPSPHGSDPLTTRFVSSTDSEGNPCNIPCEPLQGRAALVRILELLEAGSKRLADVPHYTATFHKKERVDGQVYGPQVTQLKLRQKPFSVYMKWLVGDVGREALYLDGQNDGKLLVRVGGWKGRLLPALNLDPQGSTAMKKSRHPVTEVGVGRLMDILTKERREDLQRGCGYRAWMKGSKLVKDRDCHHFELEYDHPSISPIYRKSVQYFDKETSIPIFIKNYTWPEFVGDMDMNRLDESTIIEFYYYEDLALDAQLSDADFDRENEAYHFKR